MYKIATRVAQVITLLDNCVTMFETECDHANLKAFDEKLEMDTKITLSENSLGNTKLTMYHEGFVYCLKSFVIRNKSMQG